jgi:hypothetical protein
VLGFIGANREYCTGACCVIEVCLRLSHGLDDIGSRVQGTPGCQILHVVDIEGKGCDRGRGQDDTSIIDIRKIVIRCQWSDKNTISKIKACIGLREDCVTALICVGRKQDWLLGRKGLPRISCRGYTDTDPLG